MDNTKTLILAAFASASAPSLDAGQINRLAGCPIDFADALFDLIEEGKIKTIHGRDGWGYKTVSYALIED